MLERNPSPGEEEDGAHDGEGESEATKLAQGGQMVWWTRLRGRAMLSGSQYGLIPPQKKINEGRN